MKTRYYLITEINEVYNKIELDKADYLTQLALLELRYKNTPHAEFDCGSIEYYTSSTSGLSIYTVDTKKRTRHIVAEYTDNKYFFKLIKEYRKEQ